MIAGDAVYRMSEGEVWALNNSAMHAVWNASKTQSRTHLICDFLLTAALEQLLGSADRTRGELRPDVQQYVAGAQRPSTPAAG